MKRLNNRTRFILAVVAGALKISGRKKAVIEAQLDAEGYDRMAPHRRKVRGLRYMVSGLAFRYACPIPLLLAVAKHDLAGHIMDRVRCASGKTVTLSDGDWICWASQPRSHQIPQHMMHVHHKQSCNASNLKERVRRLAERVSGWTTPHG